MKLEEINAYSELLLAKWHYAAAIALLYLVASYLVALISALGKAHGERLSGKPDTKDNHSAVVPPVRPASTRSKSRPAWQAAFTSLRKPAVVSAVIGAVAVGLLAFSQWLMLPDDPCLKPQPQRTIQEQITCERLPR